MTTENIKYGYFHVPSNNKKRYITVALSRPGKQDTNQIHTAAFAFCSDVIETFKKTRGRQIALGRLLNKSKTISFTYTGNLDKAFEEALAIAIKKEFTPVWVQKAYKSGLLVQGLVDPAQKAKMVVSKPHNKINTNDNLKLKEAPNFFRSYI